jgi:purine-cytosine permease-like protein
MRIFLLVKLAILNYCKAIFIQKPGACKAQQIQLIEDPDYKTSIVPLSKRSDFVTMTLVWIAMVTAFPTVLIGFEWYKSGYTLNQVVGCICLSCLILLAYTIPVSYLGAKSGQTFGLLCRRVFGRWGVRCMTSILVWFAIGWYALNALFLADGLSSLFKLPFSTIGLAIAMSLVMAFNNFFGFKGIANFARFLAAPVMVIWVGYTLIGALAHCPTQVITECNPETTLVPLTAISGVVIGYSVWGNEADFWRYAKPNIWATTIPLVLALMVGWVFFGTAGWMLARTSGITNSTLATNFVYSHTFGGMPILGAIVLTLSYFAMSDSCLYSSINAIQNLKRMPHKSVVLVLAFIGSAFAAWFSLSGCTKTIETIAGLSSALFPVPMTIVLTDLLLHRYVFKKSLDFSRVYEFSELASVQAAAMIALFGGWTVGILTSGVIPGFAALQVGVCPVQAVLTSIILYVPLRVLEYRREITVSRASLESSFSKTEAKFDAADGAILK